MRGQHGPQAHLGGARIWLLQYFIGCSKHFSVLQAHCPLPNELILVTTETFGARVLDTIREKINKQKMLYKFSANSLCSVFLLQCLLLFVVYIMFMCAQNVNNITYV